MTNRSGSKRSRDVAKAPRADFAFFLDQRAEALRAVKDRTSFSAWHRAFVPAWTSRASELAAAANEAFDLAAPHDVQADIGYLAVECAPASDAQKHLGYVLVSVNPGWNAATAAHEQAAKGCVIEKPCDVAQYERFRTSYFPAWQEQVATPAGLGPNRWWSSATQFLHGVAGVVDAPHTRASQPAVDVIGWELWPFHSKSDGLSAASVCSWSLQRFAGESLRAALRMPSHGVVVASRTGFELLRGQLHAEFDLGFETRIDDIFCMGLIHRPTGRRVVAARRQLFSGWGRTRTETREAMIHRFREFLESQ